MEIIDTFNSDIHLRRLENELKSPGCYSINSDVFARLEGFIKHGDPLKVAAMFLRVMEKRPDTVGADLAEGILPVFFECSS